MGDVMMAAVLRRALWGHRDPPRRRGRPWCPQGDWGELSSSARSVRLARRSRRS